MVAYCCVKGCSNNSSNKKKDPNDMTSFHAFPSNIELKQKWLKAIGRPDWVPPTYARICSGHFSYEQINHDGRRIRIKDDALPVKDLPANSNFEASDVEVCRFCLASEVRLYSLLEGVHRIYLESLAGYNENYNIEGLPQFICYECAAHLKKCYNLLEKSLTVQATLLDIFAQYGKITINLINTKNRKELNLSSPLSIQDIKTTYERKHYNDLENNENHIENKLQTNDCYLSVPKLEVTDLMTNPEEIKGSKNDEVLIEDDDRSNPFDDEFSNSDPGLDDEIKLEQENKTLDKVPKRTRVTKATMRTRLTPDECTMLQYFDVKFLTSEEQKEEWRKSQESKEFSGETVKCDICSKVFAHHNSYKLHTQGHDPSRGNAECPVCKLRFKSETLANSHVMRAHVKKFYCKLCPKAFNNVGVAKKHHKWHSGYTYKCSHSHCSFSSLHGSALGAHQRARHGGAHACARCGRACASLRGLRLHETTVHRDVLEESEDSKYRCEQCNLDFKSEGARRVHILTSKQHKKKTNLCETTPQQQSLKTTCNKCGIECPTLKALIEHRRAEHRRTKKKTSWSLPGDSYPTKCDDCETVVSNRAEHWRHVRNTHPAQRSTYQPVVTAVCDTCGKGFQNSTKLALHVLRHSAPSVRCPHCPRVLYDKYALARHVASHAPTRPYRCKLCPRAFKQKANLDRHERVHTGVTPYECSMCGNKFKYSTSMNLHVRTVHYKLPHLPRKKKSKDGSDNLAGIIK
ncbi:zinc finger protein 37-like [Leguminivora glycinivorella]|uniref:zinc finger protein 37-like n=1 Tax=Leguminivora glycinivorella TaxID=1035111 RepID=UPI00200C1188|nr:zinc finger protein 37-like [Leguminivora glycinivorella]